MYVKYYSHVYAEHRPFKRLLREKATPRGAIVNEKYAKRTRPFFVPALSPLIHVSFPGMCLEQYGKKASAPYFIGYVAHSCIFRDIKRISRNVKTYAT